VRRAVAEVRSHEYRAEIDERLRESRPMHLETSP